MVKVMRTRQRNAVGQPTTRRDMLRAAVEWLESRKLLSCAGPAEVARPQWHAGPMATDPSAIDGFSPAEVRRAYGFDGAGGDGSGQTIVIVDAYNDPSIEADLKVFDQH